MIYVLALLLNNNPYPIWAFLGDFKSLKECKEAGDKFDIPEKLKDNIGCMAIMKPSTKPEKEVRYNYRFPNSHLVALYN